MVSEPSLVAGAKPLVLVVDDDRDTRMALKELLEERGYQAATATNGQEALAYLSEQPAPACILMDLMMPVMDGWALAEELSLAKIPPIPLVVLTANPVWTCPRSARHVL